MPIPRPQKYTNYKKVGGLGVPPIRKTKQTDEEVKAWHHEYFKKYKKQNHDKINAQKEIYYNENKQRLKEERATKVPCGICDKIISVGGLKYHLEHLH
jgi:hypothetical protein